METSGFLVKSVKWNYEIYAKELLAIMITFNEWKKDGLVTWRGCLYIPLKHSLRSEVIKLNHNHPPAGHPGRDKTKELVGQDCQGCTYNTRDRTIIKLLLKSHHRSCA